MRIALCLVTLVLLGVSFGHMITSNDGGSLGSVFEFDDCDDKLKQKEWLLRHYE